MMYPVLVMLILLPFLTGIQHMVRNVLDKLNTLGKLESELYLLQTNKQYLSKTMDLK